jgi:predicted HicB family RNase H-like nuclease
MARLVHPKAVMVRFTEEDYEWLTACAQEQEQSVAQFVRWCVRQTKER